MNLLLQAAFVDFGENRHGFLPFSEIHPDYYRLPISDRSSNEDDHDFSEKEDNKMILSYCLRILEFKTVKI